MRKLLTALAVFFTAGAASAAPTRIPNRLLSAGYVQIASTQTYPNGSFSPGTLSNCIANSTATITTGANRAQICFSGSMSASTFSNIKVGILLDGAFLPGHDSSKGSASAGLGWGSAQLAADMSFCELTPVLSAGVHNVCLAAISSVGTGNIPSNVSGVENTATLSFTELAIGISSAPFAGSGGHVIATSTGTAGASLSTSTQRSNLAFGTGFRLTDDPAKDATIVNGTNFQYLASSSTIFGGATGTNTTFSGCISGSTVTLNTGNNRAMVTYSGGWSDTTAAGKIAKIYLLVDGALAGNQNATDGLIYHVNPSGSYSQNMSFSFITPTLSAGSHSACIGGATTAGGQWSANDRANGQIAFIELATGGSGFATPASTFTVIPEAAVTTTVLPASVCVPGSTVTLTTSGGDTEIQVIASAQVNAAIAMYLNVLRDGQFLSGYDGRGIIFANPASGEATNMSFTVIDRLPPSGSHSYCVAAAVNGAGTATFWNNSSAGEFSIGVKEIRNAPGTGDVSSNGNNTMSGANTFTGPMTLSNTVYGTWVEIASQTVTAATSVTFSNLELSTGAVRRIEWRYQQNTSAGQPVLTFNGFTANYRWATKRNCDNTDEVTNVSTSDTDIPVSFNDITANQHYNGHATITKFYPEGRTHVLTESFLSGVVGCSIRGGGYIAVTTNTTNEIKYATTGGTMTGTFKLYMRWDK